MDAVLSMLEAGRERVARGWTKGLGRDDAGNVCALRALAPDMGCAAADEDAVRALSAGLPGHDAAAAARSEWSSAAIRVVTFNDRPQTTQEDVLAVYDRAIAARLEALGEPPLAEWAAEARELAPA